jgi:4-hydroxy-3-polyprenylbenzoate decarboxylase
VTARDITDLRTALELLASVPGQLVSTDAEVDPRCELAAIYKQVGAGAPLPPPAHAGPAMLFRNVKGFGIPVVAGILADRRRIGLLLGVPAEDLPLALLDAVERASAPVRVAQAPCHEVIARPPFDLRRILPAITHTPEDGAPYITMGLVRAQDPETGARDVTIHRLALHGPDRLAIYFAPGRHIDSSREKAERMDRALPVSISIGFDPAIYLAACFQAPPGVDELAVAGGLRGRPIEMAECVSVAGQAIANAEIVIEGEILPGVRVSEDAPTGSGFAMPEFHGHMGASEPDTPVVQVTAITHRRDPIFQTLVGPAVERANLIGIPLEAAIIRKVEREMPGVLRRAYAHPAGGGSLLVVLQVSPSDGDEHRTAAERVLDSFTAIRQVMLVDEDVEIFESGEALWALTTRLRADGVISRPGPAMRFPGAVPRIIFNCTVPARERRRYRRPRFAPVALADYPIESE